MSRINGFNGNNGNIPPRNPPVAAGGMSPGDDDPLHPKLGVGETKSNEEEDRVILSTDRERYEALFPDVIPPPTPFTIFALEERIRLLQSIATSEELDPLEISRVAQELAVCSMRLETLRNSQELFVPPTSGAPDSITPSSGGSGSNMSGQDMPKRQDPPPSPSEEENGGEEDE